MSEGFDPFDPDEWGDKPGCSAFETALEMRGRGALAPDAVAVLEVHLGACDACREHAVRLDRIDASLAATVPLPDARLLRGKMDDALRKTRRAPLMIAGAALVMAAAVQALFWVAGVPTIPVSVWLFALVLMLAASYAGLYIGVRRLRRFLAEPDVIGAYRRWLESNMKLARWLPWSMAMNAVILAPQVRRTLQRVTAGHAREGVYLLLELIGAVLMVVAVVTQWRRVRRMKAELKELH